MVAKTIGFAVAEEDLARLERLVAKFGDGNRSAFLKEAMHRMEVFERAGYLGELQAYGPHRNVAAKLDCSNPDALARRVLTKRRP